MALIETEEAARRLARAIASDLSLYNEEKIVQGIQNDDLFNALAEEIDDVVDDMLEVAYRLELADKDTATMPELKQQAEVLVQMADEVVAMIAGLEPMQGLQPHLDAVDRLESEGDAIYRHALRRIYSDEFKARTSLYWKDVVESMEDALNTIEDISDVVEAIALKHS